MVVWRLEKGKRYRLRFSFISFCITFLLAFVSEMCYVQKIFARYIAFLFGHCSLDDLSLPSIFTATFSRFSASVWSLIFCCQKPPSILRNLRIFLQDRKGRVSFIFCKVSAAKQRRTKDTENMCVFMFDFYRDKKKKKWK